MSNFMKKRLFIDPLEDRHMMAADPVVSFMADAADAVVSGPMVKTVRSDGEIFVSSPKDNQGTATYVVNVDVAGTYIVRGLGIGLAGDKDSFYVSTNDGSRKTWAVPTTGKKTGVPVWKEIGEFKLVAGRNIIEVDGREKSTQMFGIEGTLKGKVPQPPQNVVPVASIAGDVSIEEDNAGSKSASFQVKLSAPSSKPTTVVFSTVDGTAKAGSDFTGFSAALTFAAGETVKAVSIQIAGDTTVEGNETFQVKLSAPTNATLGVATATGTITNDDSTTPPDPTGPLDPTKAPGQNFDLSNWKITLDVDRNGGTSGDAVEVKPIPATYEKEGTFETGADGAMVFTTKVNGATTSGSDYARTENRELDDNGEEAAWKVAQGGKLSAVVAVNEMPTKTVGDSKHARIVIGQIHGPEDELCRLYYDKAGKLYYINDKSTGGQELTHELKDAQGRTTVIPLNAKFSYEIVVANGSLTVSAVYNGVTYKFTETLNSFWTGKDMYFKAGLYLGVGKIGGEASSQGTGQAKVSFYDLNLSH